MSVAVYYPRYNDKQRLLLRSFVQGLNSLDVDCIFKPMDDFVPGEAETAVLFGWYKFAYEPTMKKQPIIDHHLTGTRRLIILESAFVFRGIYYQVGLNGFANNADFRPKNDALQRWAGFGIKPNKWQQSENGPVVVIGQLPRDTQVQGMDHIEWCQNTVTQCQKRFGNVVFRPHPRAEDPAMYGIPDHLIHTGNLQELLHHASAVVIWNSTTGVDAALAGVPVIAMNKGAMAYDVASHSIHEPLRRPDRTKWFNKIAYSQWTKDEISRGLPWLHLTR